MSTKDLINAIVVGDAIEIENAFNSTMSEKIAERLETMRVDVAQNMFKVQESVEELDEAQQYNGHRIIGQPFHPDGPRYQVKMKHDFEPRPEYYKSVDDAKKAIDSASKKIKEELDEEQLDELSKATLTNYINNASADYAARQKNIKLYRDNKESGPRADKRKNAALDKQIAAKTKRANQRKDGVDLAYKKLQREEVEEILASEEFAQLDELSKATLGSYIKKSRSDAARKSVLSQKQAETGDYKGASQTYGDAVKRMRGTRKAEDKLAKEEVELDEAVKVSDSSKRNYEYANGQKPKGAGRWMFSTIEPRKHDVRNDEHMKQTFTSSHTTFANASKEAAKHFKDKGHNDEIHVLS